MSNVKMEFNVVTFGETMASMIPIEPGPMEGSPLFKADIAGAESNCAIGLSRLNHSVMWISRLGADPFGQKILRTIRGEGVCTDRVQFAENESTGLMFKENRGSGPRQVYYYRKHSPASRLAREQFEGLKADYLFITGITPVLSEENRRFTFEAIDHFRKTGATVVFDPNLRTKLVKLDQAQQLFQEIARHTDILLPGKDEAALIANIQDTSNLNPIFEALHGLGPLRIAIKDGNAGAVYSDHPGQRGNIEPYPVEEIDPIGAGDAFCAGVISGLIDQLEFKEAIRRGCAMGACCVSVHGDYNSLPNRRELLDFQAGKKIAGR
jgi:2-dehydro-3-deoxygluconokinase